MPGSLPSHTVAGISREIGSGARSSVPPAASMEWRKEIFLEGWMVEPWRGDCPFSWSTNRTNNISDISFLVYSWWTHWRRIFFRKKSFVAYALYMFLSFFAIQNEVWQHSAATLESPCILKLWAMRKARMKSYLISLHLTGLMLDFVFGSLFVKKRIYIFMFLFSTLFRLDISR